MAESARPVSELFDASRWVVAPGFDELSDITYHHDTSGRIARVAFDRPEVRNAFRPHSVDELYRVLDHARMSPDVGVVLLTGNRRPTRSTPPARAGCTSLRCSA